MDRLAHGLAEDVPERDVDAADGMHHRAPPAVDGGRLVHLVPEPSDLQRVLPDQDLAQAARGDGAERGVDDGLGDGGVGVDLADAGDALVGPDPDQQDRLTAVADRLHLRQAEHGRLDRGDFHRASVEPGGRALAPSTNVNLSDRFAQAAGQGSTDHVEYAGSFLALRPLAPHQCLGHRDGVRREPGERGGGGRHRGAAAPFRRYGRAPGGGEPRHRRGSPGRRRASSPTAARPASSSPRRPA